MRLTTGANGTSADAVVNAGSILRDWSVDTRVFDVTPNAFSILAMTTQPANTLVQTAWVTPTGYLDPVPISVSGGEILVDGNTTWRTSAILDPGQHVRMRRTSGTTGTTVSVTVTIGGVSAVFSVTSGS